MFGLIARMEGLFQDLTPAQIRDKTREALAAAEKAGDTKEAERLRLKLAFLGMGSRGDIEKIK